MTRDEIVQMAREVGIFMQSHQHQVEPTKLERFAALIAAAESRKVAAWMIRNNYVGRTFIQPELQCRLACRHCCRSSIARGERQMSAWKYVGQGGVSWHGCDRDWRVKQHIYILRMMRLA